jgi:uncharacterized protein YjbJ (UPF0337 family)
MHMQIGTVDLNKLRGVSDKALGLAKEVLGVLLGNDRLQDEGEAQQERATAELKALRAELRAEEHEAEAEVAEARQRSAQKAKAAAN